MKACDRCDRTNLVMIAVDAEVICVGCFAKAYPVAAQEVRDYLMAKARLGGVTW